MKIYNSFDEIDVELKRLSLKRKIDWEEIKYSGNIIKDNLTPYTGIAPIFNGVKKFGIYFLLKKIFRR